MSRTLSTEPDLVVTAGVETADVVAPSPDEGRTYDERTFRRIALFLLFAIGISTIGRGLVGSGAAH